MADTAGTGAPSLRWARWLCCAAVLLLSAWIQWSVVQRTEVNQPIRADAAKYVAYAWNLRHHGVFSHDPAGLAAGATAPAPDRLTLPGYPAFLALFVGDGAQPDYTGLLQRATTAQMLLGIATVGVVLLIGLELLPFGWALAAALLAAISPHLATINTYLLAEGLFTFLVALSLLALLRASRDDAGWGAYALAGVAIGLTSLVRPQLQPLPFLLLLACALSPRLRPRLKKAAIGFACFLAFVGAWQLRNLDVPRGGPGLSVVSMYHGAFPELMYGRIRASYGFPYRFDPDLEAHSRDLRAVAGFVASEFREQPGRMARWYLLGKPEFFLSWNIIAGGGGPFVYPVVASPYLDSGVFRGLYAGSFLLHWPLTLLALTAMLVAAWRPRLLAHDPRRQRQLRLLALVLGTMLVLHAIGAPYPRYGIPFRPLVYLLALALLHGLWRSRREGAGAG